MRYALDGGTRSKRSSIRRSTRSDLEMIRTWLADENARELPGNFLCNIGIIERAHQNGDLLVYCDGASGEAVAFQLGGLIHPGILAVRYEYRRRGIGRGLAERCIALALKRDQPLLHITCRPRSSIPFWRAMGFTMVPGKERSGDAYRILEKPMALPSDGIRVDVEVSFYPNAKKWDDSTEPYSTHRPSARQTADGVIHLERRVAFHEAAADARDDLVVEIVVNAVRLHIDKAKYEESVALGFVRCPNGYYLDRIKPSSME